MGQKNIASVFGAKRIPSDNHIRSLLDGAPANSFAAGYEWLWSELKEAGILADYQFLGRRLLVGIDGIQYFTSSKIHCEQCSRSEHDGKTRYSHRALTALVVHPEQHEVLALPPEFILPQDGAEKQDSELAAAKRWVGRRLTWLQALQAVLSWLLGLNDRNRPLCRSSVWFLPGSPLSSLTRNRPPSHL